ncbi:MAG: glycine/betaine ABC transporter substrate-binding protein [Treponema sp.]|nr:glycine/betaine ABC transporter substrate-binding protein [Treponema sp.]
MRKMFLYVVIAMFFVGCSGREDVVVIGSKDYSEQLIIGNILQILIDENSELKTRLVPNLSSNVIFAAIKSSDVHLYVEYSGTIYSNYFGNTERRSPQEVLSIARTGMEQHDILVLEELGFNNTYTLSVRQDTAERYNLRTISDLVPVAPTLVLGSTNEFTQRNDGLLGVQAVYGIDFKDIVVLAGNLRYTALANNNVQVMDAYSTDGLLLRYDLAILEDDLGVFPYYHAVPIIRRDIAEKHPELVPLLSRLAGTLGDDSMRRLNYRVDVDQEDPREVARSFLVQAGLIGQ